MGRLIALVALGLLGGCAAYEAVVGFFESSDAAAQAAEESADQLTDTLHSIEHFFLLIPAYLMGEARRPLWSKWVKRKNGKDGKKSEGTSGKG